MFLQYKVLKNQTITPYTGTVVPQHLPFEKKPQRGKRYNIRLTQHQLKELPPKADINFCNTDSYYFAKDE